MSGFRKGWGCSSQKPQTYPARTPFFKCPLDLPYNPGTPRMRNITASRNNANNYLLLYNQREMNLQTESPGVGEGFPNQRCQPPPSIKDPSAICTNSRVFTCLAILATCFSLPSAPNQAFLQSPLLPLLLHLFFLKLF